MKEYTIEELKTAIQNKGYEWFDDGKKDFLNIIGIRSSSNVPNTFDDSICIVWKGEYPDGSLKEVMVQFDATTKPGIFWLNHPDNVLGTAILVPGQYKNSWAIGLHHGYEALTQIKSVKVYRDNDKDSQFDYTNIHDSGLAGINIHRANIAFKSTQVDKWSAGCSVIADPKNFDSLMRLAHSSATIRQNTFNYTLLLEKDLD